MQITFGRTPPGVALSPVNAGGVRGEWLVPKASPDAKSFILYQHGGGYVACSPGCYRSLTGALALRCDARVFVTDYRRAPEHPFPAALEDVLATYDWLTGAGVDPADIVAGGDSAGGGLTLSFLLALRERGSKPIAGAFLLSPWVDLTASGDSIRTNARSDDVIVHDGSDRFARMYAGDRALDDPLVSGLYADLRGLPPLLVQASEIEMLRDDSVRLVEKARAAGVDAHLHLFDGVHHVWQLFTNMPESRQALGEIATFVKNVAAGTPR
jgi:acetyl esterase/lipase